MFYNNLSWKDGVVLTYDAPLYSFPQDATELLIIPNTQRRVDDELLADLLPPIHVITKTLTNIPQQYTSTAYIDSLKTTVFVVLRVSNESVLFINAKIVDGMNTTNIENVKLTVYYK